MGRSDERGLTLVSSVSSLDVARDDPEPVEGSKDERFPADSPDRVAARTADAELFGKREVFDELIAIHVAVRLKADTTCE
jgi:hypothetical protein